MPYCNYGTKKLAKLSVLSATVPANMQTIQTLESRRFLRSWIFFFSKNKNKKVSNK